MRELDRLFAPRGIAVIGASRHPGKLGATMTRSLAGCEATVVGVNPRDPDPASGRFASMADAAAAAPNPLDLAVLCVPASASSPALEDAIGAGIGAALVCSGGFAESGRDGLRYQQELVQTARSGDICLLGPNTSGFVVPGRNMVASFVPGAASVPPGPIAVVAASGGVNHVLAFLLADSGTGVSIAMGLGNAADVAAPEVLCWLADEPSTRAVALHVESLQDGPALMAAVERLTETTPVAALVVGRNDVAEFARSHTGTLATSWRATRAALRSAGAVLVDDERELVDATKLSRPSSSLPSPALASAL